MSQLLDISGTTVTSNVQPELHSDHCNVLRLFSLYILRTFLTINEVALYN